MTQKQLVELIQQHHPHIRETEARSLLNRAQDQFCAESEIIETTFTINTTAGKRYYPLPNKVLKVTNVQYNDVDIPRLLERPIIDDDEYVG